MNDDARAKRILQDSRTIAVLGIHDELARPAAYVPAYLANVGYQVFGVNPALVGRYVLGNPVVSSLADLHVPIDMVDVFRRADALPGHVDELIAAKPKVVWLQLGIRNDEVARQLERHGIEVIQDRCTLADHKAFGLGHQR